MRKHEFYLVCLFIMHLAPGLLNAQCTGGTNGGALSPAPSNAYQTKVCAAGDFYYTFVVAASSCFPQYDFSFCSSEGGVASFDTQISILDNSGAAVAGGYNDDYCSTQSRVIWTPTSAGTYRLRINRYSCLATTATATLAYKYTSTYTNTAEYTVNDDAVSSGSCTTLTSNTTNQRGCVWDVNSTLNFSSNFSYDFTVNLGSNDAGADGMAFVIQNDPKGRCACGTAGGSLGAGGISNSLIVEIDTYLNAEDRDDGALMASAGVVCAGGPDPDHLDIWLNGNVNPAGSGCPTPAGARIIPSAAPTLSAGTNYNIENGLDHVLRISWVTGSPGTLTARLLNAALNYTFATVSYAFNPITVFGTNTPFFGFTGSTGGLSNQQTICNALVLLPVELISFDINCQNENLILQWSTLSEKNNKYFEIEKSYNGSDYFSLATIEGSGNSYNLKKYQYIDHDANQTVLYYRLKQVDVNLNVHYFNQIRAINNNCKKAYDVVIFPNPANDLLSIILPPGETGETEIINNCGQIVYKNSIKNQLDIGTMALASGIYIVKISNAYKTLTHKLVITH